MSMGFTGELTIATQVSDLDKALAWYHEMLGAEVLYKVPEMGWAEVTSPVARTAIGLSQVEKPKTTGCVPVWAVADIDKARARLESRAVRFDGDTITVPGMVRLATFFDPDGNAWMLSQSLMQH
ncbi:MAG: VOC family protein [Phycisphaerales bacterium]|nr:VOC family protein [Phycisphaerales bacterium]